MPELVLQLPEIGRRRFSPRFHDRETRSQSRWAGTLSVGRAAKDLGHIGERAAESSGDENERDTMEQVSPAQTLTALAALGEDEPLPS